MVGYSPQGRKELNTTERLHFLDTQLLNFFFLHREVEVGSRKLPRNNLAGRVRSGGDLGGSLASGFPGGASGKESAC